MKHFEEENQFCPHQPLYKDQRLHIIFGVSLIAFMGIPSITPAFPRIVQDLRVSPQNVGLLITAFTLPNTLFSPILGVLADRLGRKVILISSLMVFSFAGIACALATNFNFLLVMRFLQGTGASSLIFLNLTLIGDFYSDDERIAAMGYNAAAISAGTASYPLIGGALAVLGWNYPFLLTGLGIPMGVWVWKSLESAKPRASRNMATYLQQALRSIRGRQFVGLFVGVITTFILLCGTCMTYLPLLIQRQLNVSTFTVGLLLSVLFATVTLVSSQFSRLVRICSQILLVQLSFLLYAAALAMMPWSQDMGTFLIPVVIYGIALGIGLPSIQSLLTELTPPECRAAVMSLNGAVLGLGQALGPILLGLVYRLWKLEYVFFAGAAFALGTFVFLRVCLNSRFRQASIHQSTK